MEEIEPFVRRLCNEEDLSVLTKKMVRKRYQSHFKKDSVSPEERQKINEVLDVILEELARGNKILIADGTTEESTVSPEQGKENLCDYQNHTSTNSPATSFRHRIVHKIPRSELEGSLSGPTHLKQIGLPLRREHKKESVLGLSDRHESTQDSGCVSITFTNSADEDSTTDNAEKSVTIPTTEGRVSGRSKGDLQCSPCRHDAALTDVWQETEEEDDVRLVSVSPQVNKCAKGSVSESVQINQPSFQSKIEESGDSGDYVSEGETTRPHNTDSPLTEPKLSVDCVRQHKNQHRKVVNLQSAVAAVTSSDSDSCTEPRSKGLYCVPKKHWRISGLSIKTEPLLPHKLEALGEKSNGKISCNTNSITLLHKKSKDFNKTEHVQSSPEETRGKQFAAKDSDYDASEECSSVFSSPAHVSTSKNWSRAKLTARQAQDILVTELQSGDIPASLSGAQIDSCPQTSNMYPTNMDSGSAFHKVSPLSEASNARSIIDTLLKISKKRRSAEAKSPEKRLRKQAFCNTLQISHPDSNSDDLPLMCIRWQRDQDNYVVASRHNSVRSSNNTLNKKLAPHSNSGSDEKLEPYKTSRNMKVKNVFDTTTSESSAQLSEIYFSPPSSSSKQSAKGRGLGLRVKQSRGGKQLQKPKPQDVSVYSLSGETTEDSSRRIRKHTGKVYKESDPWEVHPYCGESFRQAVIVLEDVSMKRRCKSKQSVKNSLHRKGASTVLKLQNKGLCHNAISNNMHSSDSDLIVEMDSSVYHKSPIVQPQQSPSESRVTAYAPILLPIAQMEGEMEIVLDASRDEEWMVSSSSSTDSLSGKTKITLRRKWTNSTKRAVGRGNGMHDVGRACSDFRLCGDLPLDRTSDVNFAEQANCEEKSKRRKINRLSSSDDDDSSQDALLAEDSSGVEQLSYTIQKSDGDSDGETSELSKSSGSEDENGLSESPMKIKSKKPSSRKRLRSISPDNKQTKTESRPQSEKTEKTEHPYLKRLKLICRKVGIFVRSDVHFAGCQTDKDRIERLKEVLRKAGMKGQPSLSKVDSVNLKKEAADLDPSNIIETSGRPRRQLKGFFAGETSSSKVEISTRQQFSRIQDLVTVSDSD